MRKINRNIILYEVNYHLGLVFGDSNDKPKEL